MQRVLMSKIIYAPNIHSGGGRVLLDLLLKEVELNGGWFLIIDNRVKVSKGVQDKILFKVKPNIFSRLLAEFRIFFIHKKFSKVLFFSNLPPLFKLSTEVVLFIQNIYLVSKEPIYQFRLKDKLRLAVGRIWIKFFICNVTRVMVQSDSMRRQVLKSLKLNAELKAFIGDEKKFDRSNPQNIFKKLKTNKTNKKNNFLYVASGEPHKNHRILIESWKLLSANNIFPSLFLTLDQSKHPELCDWISIESKKFDLKIINLGLVDHENIQDLYLTAGALIYPSLFESFGLPLLEASKVGLPVVAAELDYVRDLIDPDQTFNPLSAFSISKAVERFLKIKPKKESEILTPYEFLKDI
jgi:glycosyltransferase involved in cell wall biosynthesis